MASGLGYLPNVQGRERQKRPRLRLPLPTVPSGVEEEKMTVINFSEFPTGGQSDMNVLHRFASYRPDPVQAFQIAVRPLGDPAFARRNAIKIATLPTRTIIDTEKEKCDVCTVCRNDWATGDQVKTLPCLHCFHTTCIDPWLEQKLSCPSCRHRV